MRLTDVLCLAYYTEIFQYKRLERMTNESWYDKEKSNGFEEREFKT